MTGAGYSNTAPHRAALYSSALHCTVLLCTALHTLQRIALDCAPLGCMHCTGLCSHWAALHCNLLEAPVSILPARVMECKCGVGGVALGHGFPARTPDKS